MKILVLAAALSLPLFTVTAQTAAIEKAVKMTEAKGSFDIKMAPTAAPAEGLAGYTLDKVYHGELEATGTGQMMSGGDPASGNAGYVAIERITGKLGEKSGSFALMQQGTMIKGSAPQMTVTIVPGSGTGDLSGIYGSMTIVQIAGKHEYTIFYSFAQ